MNLNFSYFNGDISNLKNSFLNTRTMITLNNQEIDNFFLKKEKEIHLV